MTPTKRRIDLLLALALALLPAGAEAKAYFAPFETMVREADAIVVLEILSSRPDRPEEADRQCKDSIVTVKVEQVIIGGRETLGEIRIPCFFPCAIVESAPGRYLAFLKVRDGLLTNSNWHLSLLPVTGEAVRWYGKNARSKEDIPLESAAEKIRKIRAAPEGELSP